MAYKEYTAPVSQTRPDSKPGRLNRDSYRAGLGSALGEFALIAPVFLLLAYVMAEGALFILANRALQHSIADAAIAMRPESADPSGASSEALRSRICDSVRPFIDCDNRRFTLDIRTFAGVEGLTDPPGEGAVPPSDSLPVAPPGNITIVRASYRWRTDPITGRFATAHSAEGYRSMSAFAMVYTPLAVPAGASASSPVAVLQ